MSNDRRRNPRATKRADARRKPPPASRGREALILAAIAVPILVIAAIAVFVVDGGVGDASPPPAAGASGAAGGGQATRLVYPDSPTLGPADAPVTLVEYLDPECESCRAFYPVVKDVMGDYEGQIRLVVRYVPYHGNSALAYVALEEAGRQGRYWEALEFFFARQPEWGEKQEPQTEAFLAYGEELGLDVEAMRAAFASPDLTKLERDAADAEALGVSGTPTFFVNGTVVEDFSEQGLRDAIDRALGS
ncbi:MAG TPA: thioredoxin domain-containing protein [Candidatus Binatia bacterium]|nr:thioredoxin domain-containing protein [Candidatus Binatia bacterium]